MSTTEYPPELMADDELATVTFNLCVALATVSTVVVLLRCYARAVVIKQWGLDDTLAVIVMLMSTTYSVSIAVSTRLWGVGYHAGHVMNDPVKYRAFLKFQYVSVSAYIPVALMLKLSISAFLLRVFSFRTRPIMKDLSIWKWFRVPWRCTLMKKIMYSLNIFLVVFSVANEICVALQCTPIPYMWDRGVANGHCYTADQDFAISMSQNVVFFVTDFFVLLLPVPFLWRLKLPMQQKLLLTAVFGTGLVACIAAVVRAGSLSFYKASEDITYGLAKALMWIVIEISLGLITSSFPACHSLFRRASNIDSSSRGLPGSSGAGRISSGGTPLNRLSTRSKGHYKQTLPDTTLTIFPENESQERIVSEELNAKGGIMMSTTVETSDDFSAMQPGIQTKCYHPDDMA